MLPNPKVISLDKGIEPPSAESVLQALAPLLVQASSWHDLFVRSQFRRAWVKPSAARILARANWLAMLLASDEARNARSVVRACGSAIERISKKIVMTMANSIKLNPRIPLVQSSGSAPKESFMSLIITLRSLGPVRLFTRRRVADGKGRLTQATTVPGSISLENGNSKEVQPHVSSN